MYEVLEPFIEITAYIIDGYCLCMLFREFGERRIKNDITTNALIVLAWFVINMAIKYFVFANPPFTLGNRMTSFIIRVGAAYLIVVFLYKSRQVIYLFIALLFTALRYIASQIGFSVRLFLVYGAERLMWHVEALNNMTFIKLLIDSIYVFTDMTAVLLIYFSVKIMVREHKYEISDRSTKEIIFYMLPAIMGSLASVVLYFILLMINEQGNIIDYDNYIEIYLFITIVFVAVWMIILYGFRLQTQIMDLQKEQMQKSVYENQILQMQSSMMEMERFYESISHVKHDMKNQMAVLEKLLTYDDAICRQISKNEGITQYFDDMRKTLLALEQKIHTGNVVSDAVIGSKFYYAAKEIKGINLEAGDFILTDKVGVRAYDIGIILNNGLDNAIEACKKVRLNNPDSEVYILIKTFWKQKMFFIEIENSFDGEVKWGKDGYPVTLKSGNGLHGIGLKNIRYCAMKYTGDIDCIAEEGRFILSIMLKGNGF